MSIFRWSKLFYSKGIEGLYTSTGWKQYPRKFKNQLSIISYRGSIPFEEIIHKHQISTTGLLQRWIRLYNSHRALKGTRRGRANSMTKGRKITWKERIKIVQNCLENGKNYQVTAEQYQVS